MYRLLRSIRLKPATQMEAMQIAQEIAAYINKKFKKTKVQVCTPAFSDMGKVVWFGDYENLAAIEEINQKLMADEKYIAIVMKLVDKIIEGSGKDELFRFV